MAFARARAVRTLHSSLRRALPRSSRPSRTQLVQRRYASEGGGHAESGGSDLPWALGALVVTVPSCYFLWPQASHADAGHHGEHEEHAESGEGEEKSEEAGQEEAGKDGEESSGEESEKGEDSSGDDPSEEKKGDEKSSAQPGGDDSEKADDEGSEDSDKSSESESTGSDEGKEQKKGKGETGGKDLFASSGDPKDSAEAQSAKGKSEQFGVSTGPTKHSTPIHEDPNKSKKADGTPETAKAKGTVKPGGD